MSTPGRLLPLQSAPGWVPKMFLKRFTRCSCATGIQYIRSASIQDHPSRAFKHALPGNAWKNGYNEWFNGTLRREVLNAEWFTTTKQAQIVINHWLRQYNHTRPHQALNMRPPVPETLLEKSQITGTETGG